MTFFNKSLTMGSMTSIPILIVCCIAWLNLAYVSVQALSTTVAKESYLTYADYIHTTNDTITIIPLPNWEQLDHKPPLIGKFTGPQDSVIQISKFEGAIGRDIDNINRWRRQLSLAPVTTIGSMIKKQTIGPYSTKIMSLTNGTDHVTIHWITHFNAHFFIKTTSTSPIDSTNMALFIKNQPWELL